MTLIKIWNGRILGLAYAALVLFSVVFKRLVDTAFSVLIKVSLSKVGRNVRIQRGCVFRYPSNIEIGNNVVIGRNVEFTSELATGFLKIEDNVQINENCRLDFTGGLVIGKGTVISSDVHIQTHSHGKDPRSKPTPKSLSIGESVWIGFRASILDSTRSIGNGVVIGGCSVVTKPVDCNLTVVGVPATPLTKS